MSAYEEILKTKTVDTVKNGFYVWKTMLVLSDNFRKSNADRETVNEYIWNAIMVFLDNYRSTNMGEGTMNEYLNALRLLSKTFEYKYFREYLNDIFRETGSVDISKVEEVLK